MMAAGISIDRIGQDGSPSFSHCLLDLLDGINNLDIEPAGEEDDTEEDPVATRPRYSIPRQRLNPKPLLQMIGESTEQFQTKSLSFMEQQDAQELLSALLGVVIAEAQLDALSDRLFMDESGKAPPIDDANEGSLVTIGNSHRVSRSSTVLEEDDIDAVLTLAMANAREANEVSSPQNEETESLGKSSLGLSIDGEDNHVLSLSGLLSKIESEKKKQAEVIRGDSLDAISAVKPQLCIQQGRKHDRLSFQEEKKQDCCEDVTCPSDDSPKPTPNLSSASLRPHRTTSMNFMTSTISAITPSPLSGWLGSIVQCARCMHVRPIQNAPFLDIPLVPTSVPSYIGNAYHSPSQPVPPNSPSIPPCALGDCLAEFTSVERVQDVECRFCTIQREVKHFEEEAMMLRGAMETMEKRLQKRHGNGNRNKPESHEETSVLKNDLAKVERRLLYLKRMDPDADDFSAAMDVSEELLQEEFLDLLGDDNENMVKIERCEARKCLLLTRTPSILCCHIQRRYFDPFTNRMEKCVQHVEFPEVLDISPYCAYGPRASTPWAAGSSNSLVNGCKARPAPILNSSQGRMPYRLRSIVEHKGNANAGHYVSYRRDKSGQWFMISDNNVQPRSWQDVRCSQAYLLFYEAL
jgi:Ubiquitin carboxyl-terminal hydrolase